MSYGFTPSDLNQQQLLAGRFVLGKKKTLISLKKAAKQLALWLGRYLKFGEVIVAVMSTSLANHHLAVLNPGSLVDTGCLGYTPT